MTDRRERRALIGLVLVGIVITGITAWVGARAAEMPDCASGDMIDLQLARTPERAAAVLSDSGDRTSGGRPLPCDSRSRGEVRRTLALDAGLLVPLYAATLSYWCLVAGRRAPPRTRGGRSSLVAGAVAAWLAGVFDWIENAALTRVVTDRGATTSATALALAASVTKWLLVSFSVLMALGGLGRLVRRLVRRQATGPDPRHGVAVTDPWTRAADVPGVEGPADLGISFSGGGIRSASFCMGALQVLEETPSAGTSLFRRARWLTSVSGGGYLAGARQMLARLGVASPFQAGSAEVDHVRRHGRYLADSPVEWVTAVARAVAGLVLNLAVFWLMMFVLARPVGWLHANIWSQNEIEANARPLSDPALWAIVGLPAGAAVALVLLAVLARPRTDAAVPFSPGGLLWWSAGILAVAAVAAAGIALLVPVADDVAADVLKLGEGAARAREAAAAGGVGLLTALMTVAKTKAPSRSTFDRWLRLGGGGDAGADQPGGPRPARFPRLGKVARPWPGSCWRRRSPSSSPVWCRTQPGWACARTRICSAWSSYPTGGRRWRPPAPSSPCTSWPTRPAGRSTPSTSGGWPPPSPSGPRPAVWTSCPTTGPRRCRRWPSRCLASPSWWCAPPPTCQGRSWRRPAVGR